MKLQLAVPQTVNQRDLYLGLIQGAKLGFSECVACILEAGISPDKKDNNGDTPLHLAVKANQLDVVRTLINHNATINLRGSGKSTPLHIAAKFGYEECMKALIENKANVNLKDADGNTPLILTVKYDQYIVTSILVRNGCDLNVKNNKGFTALHYACHKARGFNTLLQAGADPNVKDDENITPLIMAASEGLEKVIKALVEAKCDVNVANTNVGKTALHILAYKGHPDSIFDLIVGGADVNLYDKDLCCPLWYAIKNQRFEVVKLLLRANCEADSYQCASHVPRDCCPTRLAFSLKMINVIKLFILTGYDKNHVIDCLKEDGLKESVSKDLEHWIEHAHGVLTLKQTCRKWIRHHLGTSFYHDLQCLPVPQAMKDFIFMKELDDDDH